MTAKDLKNAILQEAVQGKLVPQIASEGNAKDLLQQIKAEKAKLVKEGKIKKEKPLPVITEDEIPFDIPENWCWCRLGELGDFTRGSGIKRDETTKEGFPCVRYGEMYTTYKVRFLQTKSFTSKEVFNKCHKIHSNDILMALTGENKWDIALAAVYEGNDELAMGGDLCKFTPIKCDSSFLVYLINSPYGIEYKRNTSTGDIIVHTSTSKLGNLLIPLPPLAEQKRIVAAIEKFMPLIEEYGKKESVLKDLNANIGTLTKKAILQEAVQGKLVPQIASEGNAKDLLEQIKAEKAKLVKEGKIKKEKPLPEITEEEIPFDIPENWCWCRLGDIVNIKSGDGLTASQMREGSIPVFGGNGITGYHNTANIHKETIVIGRVGFYCGSVHVTPKEAWVTDNAFITTYPERQIDRKFLVHVLCHLNLGQDNNATAQPVVSGKKIYPMLFPLPPLSEQKRIVEAIEKLLPLCEKFYGE